MRRCCAGLALLLVSSGCAQFIGIDAPSGESGGFSDDGGPDTRDGGFGFPNDANMGLCAPAPSFKAATNYGVGTDKRKFALGDLNHDGFVDVVIPDEMAADTGHVLLVLHGTGNQTFGNPQDVSISAPQSCMPGASTVAVGDFDANGFYDLVAFACPTTLVVRRQNPSAPGQFLAEQPLQLPPTSMLTTLLATDLNGDARDDLVYVDFQGVHVLLARVDVAGAFTAGFTDAAPARPGPDAIIDAADLNGDDLVDLAWMGQDGMRFALQGAGTPGQFGSSTVLGTSTDLSFAIGPVNGDTLNDVLMFRPPTVRVFLQNPTNHAFTAGTNFEAAVGAKGLRLVDVNGDGRADLASGGDVLLQCAAPAPAGTFQSTQSAPPVHILDVAEAAQFVDVTGEGKVDALGLDPADGLLVVRLQQ